MNNGNIDKIIFDQIIYKNLLDVIIFIKEINPPISQQLGDMHYYDLSDMEI